ncbi:MAG: GspE/PulE family protein [Clostridia bacterium]|nr:GspE/PulE family protein [Clostridia bacterium]
MRYKRLGDLLMSVGLITEKQLQEALKQQKITKKRLGDQLIISGYITQNQLIKALQMQLGIEFIDLSNTQIPPELSQVVPKNIAKKYSVVPVKLEKGTLFLAMADPMNFMALEEVKTATRKHVEPMIGYSDAIDRAIMDLYGNEGAVRAIEEMKREINVLDESSGLAVNLLDENGAKSAPTIRLVNSIIERAITVNASDIHIEPHKDSLNVRMRIDGLMHHIMEIPHNLQDAVITRLKVMGGMDISEHRVPLDGRSNVLIKNRDIDLRMSTLPTIYGEKVVIRLLDKSSQILTKEKIGLSGHDLKKYEKLISFPSGVVLMVGPTGSGKSSTMYTMIDELNKETVNLVTLEDPVEYNIDGINQVQINEKAGMTFAGGLRSILRQDPDIIAVGEIRDGETAQIAMRAALTGHLVLSTIHTNDAVSTIDRLENMGVEPYLVSAALRGMISQRLVRKVCPYCREEYTPDDDELGFMGIEKKDGIKFYRAKGCPQCFNTGYKGRIGVFEIITFNRKIRQAVLNHLDRESVLDVVADSEDFVSLSENCRRLVLEGTTTVEEAKKCMNTDD